MADNIDWVTSRAMAEILGVSVRTLYDYRKEGTFQLGRHYKRQTPAPGAPFIWDRKLATRAWTAATSREVQ